MRSIILEDPHCLIPRLQEEKDAYGALYFTLLFIPNIISLRILTREYGTDFWSELRTNRDKLFSTNDIWEMKSEEYGELKPIEKIRTHEFIDIPDSAICFWKSKSPKNYHKTDDDLAYFWEENNDIKFSDEFNSWVEELKHDFDGINSASYNLLQETEFLKELIEVLEEADTFYKRIYAYQDMFYEFVAHSGVKEYQSALKLLKKIIEDNKEIGAVVEDIQGNWNLADKNITFNIGRLHVKRLLSIYANISLRKKVFGF